MLIRERCGIDEGSLGTEEGGGRGNKEKSRIAAKSGVLKKNGGLRRRDLKSQKKRRMEFEKKT